MVIRFVVIVMTWLFSTTPAHAYLDPGTGSMLLQGLIAAIAASTLFLRGRWSAFKSLCARLFGRPSSQTTPAAHDRNIPPTPPTPPTP